MMNTIKKPKIIVLILVALILMVVTSPYWLWAIKPQKQLNVLIMDKTVPDKSYREHKGLVWVLNNEKYVKKNDERYSYSKDYIGFKPLKKHKYKVDKLPNNLSKYDMIYLTDQYGVYKEEFHGKNTHGNRSEQLYGGLQEEEVSQIENSLLKGRQTLIAEFNTFGSPTSEAARDKISNLLNVDWSGWIGRYFNSLESDEVPGWVKESYTKKTGEWNFSGSGFVFVDKSDFVVVLENKNIKGNGAQFKLTENGEKRFDRQLDSNYQYWFDIIHARNNKEVLASYSLPLTASGKKVLDSFGIPDHFPAIISHQNAKYASYYFAGDFADEGEVPGIYQTRGFDKWKRIIGNNDSFYWKAYVPIMKNILSKGKLKKMDQEEVELVTTNGLKMNSRTDKSFIQVQKNGRWEDILIKGVNMGIAKPGAFPGETAITKEEYLRWLKQIGDMHANALRIYTLHPPQFYEAFYEYNSTAKKPLYLFHGAWVNEKSLVETNNAYSLENIKDFQTELTYMVDIIHGQAELPERKGHASGKYTADISKYVLGFIIGIEWDPIMVHQTDLQNKNKPQLKGTYFHTENASPFEIWLAQMMEYTAKYEAEKYNWQHTMSFTNWVTTDLLKHPIEPLEEEDLASVNPNHISKTDKFHAGLFASYHIYPYYPDFLNFDEKYLNYKDWTGKKNNYAGYLHDLISAHKMPVVVAEYGVPASRGLTHKNKYGMNQGFHSEEEQGYINKRLFSSIIKEGYAGGLVFSWQDEWFKRTWNTMDLDNEDRRPFWSNVQTNEQRFGLLAFEPGVKDNAIFIDGDRTEWRKQGEKASSYESKKNSGDLLKEMKISSDEQYVYFMQEYRKPINWKSQNITILFDTIDSQGQRESSVNSKQKVKTDFGVDFMLNLKGEKDSELLVDSYYDSFYYQYGVELRMIPSEPGVAKENNGVFHPIRLALNKKLKIPESGKIIPFEAYETGKLKFGNANPLHKDYDSLADISVSQDKKIIEGRIPWQLLNFKDPSQKEVMGNLWKQGLKGKKRIEDIAVASVISQGTEIEETMPKQRKGMLNRESSLIYQWDDWEEPKHYERLKKSYYIMKELYSKAGKEEIK